MIAYFTDRTWSLKNFTSNYVFIVFWVNYLVCKIAITFFKKAILKKDENS